MGRVDITVASQQNPHELCNHGPAQVARLNRGAKRWGCGAARAQVSGGCHRWFTFGLTTPVRN